MKRRKLYTIYNVNITKGTSLSAYHWHETCIPGFWQRYFVSKCNNEAFKSMHLRMVTGVGLCSYKLWFKRLEASTWATKIQNDRNLEKVIALRLIKFTFTSCHFEILNNLITLSLECWAPVHIVPEVHCFLFIPMFLRCSENNLSVQEMSFFYISVNLDLCHTPLPPHHPQIN